MVMAGLLPVVGSEEHAVQGAVRVDDAAAEQGDHAERGHRGHRGDGQHAAEGEVSRVVLAVQVGEDLGDLARS